MFGLGLTKIIPVAIYLVISFTVILSAFKKTKLGFYIIVFLNPLQVLTEKFIAFPFGKDIMDIIIFATLISTYFRNKKEENIYFDKSILYPVGLIGICGYLTLWVSHFRFGIPMPITFDNKYFIMWKNFMLLPILYFITINSVSSKKDIILTIYVICGTVFLMGGYFFNSSRYTDYSTFSWGLKSGVSGLSSIYLGTNEIATFWSQVLMFLLSFSLFDTVKKRKLFFLGVCLECVYCIVHLFSRGAYLSTIISLLFLGVVKNRKIIILLILLFVFWDAVLPTAVVERIKMTTDISGGLDHSTTSRFEMWKKGLEGFKMNPVTGVGFGGTELLGIANTSRNKGVRRNIHNGYLALLIEQGVIGFVLWMYLLFGVVFKKGWYLYRKSDDPHIRGLGLGFFTMSMVIIIENLVGTTWFYFIVMGYFWIILGLVDRSLKIMKDEIDTVRSEEAT